jgi:hypothetical protein
MSLASGRAQGRGKEPAIHGRCYFVAESNCGGKTVVLPDHMLEVRLLRFSLMATQGTSKWVQVRETGAHAATPTGVPLCRLHLSNIRGQEGRKDEMKGAKGGWRRTWRIRDSLGSAPFEIFNQSQAAGIRVPLSIYAGG